MDSALVKDALEVHLFKYPLPNGMPNGITNIPEYEAFMANSPEEQQKYLDSQK